MTRMLRRLRPRSVYDVMALLALFIFVAGGSAYAAATIGSGNIKNNAVLSRHIKNGEVKNADLANNSIGTGKVADGSLLRQDFKAGQVPKGPKGDQGAGATQFDLHVQNGTGIAGPTVDGVSVSAYCDSSNTLLSLASIGLGTPSVGVGGLAIADGAFEQISYRGSLYQLTKSANSFDLDVVARNESVNRWTHFVVGTYNDHTGHGCAVWGVITPSTYSALP